MKLFEDLMDASAKLADKAAKVASEAFEQTKVVAEEAMDKGKKKVNELELKNDLSKAQKQLGELYYVLRKTGESNDELLTQYFNAVAEIEAKLEALKAEAVNEEGDYAVVDATEEPAQESAVEELKEEVTEIVADVKEDITEAIEEIKDIFDGEDAAPGEKAEEVIELSVKVCPSCGAAADETDTFCRECGKKIEP